MIDSRFPAGHDTLLTDTGGTYHFMCPEICAGQVHDGFKADVSIYKLTYITIPIYHIYSIAIMIHNPYMYIDCGTFFHVLMCFFICPF